MSSTNYASYAVGAALFTVSAAYMYSKSVNAKIDKVTPQKQIGDKLLMRLLEGEQKGMLRAPSINTITFYSGKVSRESLLIKVTEIVSANPWLLCRLVNSPEFGETCALFPTKFDPNTDIHDCFQVISDSTISASTPYNELSKQLAKAIVPTGLECVGKDIGQFKVTLVEIKPEQEYAIVVSLSHSIGDGHTFYTLYSMLDINTPARSLVYERKHEFTEAIRSTSGVAFHNWLTSPFLIMGIVRTLLMPLPKVTAFTINKSHIAAIKREYVNNNKDSSLFLSTNDIVTSWFCRFCRSPFGFMAVNYRNKFADYTDNLAGNYEGIIYYNETDFATPSGIRRSLTTFNKDSKLPTPLQTIDFNIAVVTNWSSFYCDVNLLNEPKQTMHFPLMKISDCLFRDTCVVFNTAKDTQGVMLFCRTSQDVTKLMEASDDSVKLLGNRII